MNLDILSKEFAEKVKSDLKLDDLVQENINNISKQHYYLQLLIEKRRELIRVEKERESVFKELYHYYKFDYNFELKNSEIELYVCADEKYKKIKTVYQLKELEIKYLEEVVKMFQNRNFSIKNAIELEKMKT